MMGWFARDLVPGRELLGWVSLFTGLVASAAFLAAIALRWPGWSWGFFGLAQCAAAVSWYARGRISVLSVLAGGLGSVVLSVSVVLLLSDAV